MAPQSYQAPTQPSHWDASQKPDPQLNYTDPIEYARRLDAYYENRFNVATQSASAPILARQAETERHLSRTGTHADAWRRWEPEIEAELAGIPLHERSRALYDKAAEIVQGRHWRDLVREETERLAAQGGSGTERGVNTGVAFGLPAPDPLEAFLASEHPYAKASVANGLKATDIRAHCAMMKIPVEDWLRDAQAGQLIANANAVARSFE